MVVPFLMFVERSKLPPKPLVFGCVQANKNLEIPELKSLNFREDDSPHVDLCRDPGQPARWIRETAAIKTIHLNRNALWPPSTQIVGFFSVAGSPG